MVYNYGKRSSTKAVTLIAYQSQWKQSATVIIAGGTDLTVTSTTYNMKYNHEKSLATLNHCDLTLFLCKSYSHTIFKLQRLGQDVSTFKYICENCSRYATASHEHKIILLLRLFPNIHICWKYNIKSEWIEQCKHSVAQKRQANMVLATVEVLLISW